MEMRSPSSSTKKVDKSMDVTLFYGAVIADIEETYLGATFVMASVKLVDTY